MTEELITMKIEGLEEINRALAQFPKRIANKVLKAGAAAGGRVLYKAQRAAAPVRQTGSAKLISYSTRSGRGQSDFRGKGFLKKNIKSRYIKKRSGPGIKIYGVGPVKDAFYGYIVERGHRVGKRPSKKVQSMEQAGTMQSPKMVAPHPFLIPTFNANIIPITRAIKDKLSEGIVKEGAKLGFNSKR